jgi:hypothetical protein
MQHALPRLVVVCLAASLLNTPPARADVAVLTPSADTSLFEYNPGNNLGAMPYVPAGVTGAGGGGARARGLFKFDIAGNLPSNAIITSATLMLRVTKVGETSFAMNFHLRRALRDWGEGNKTDNIFEPGQGSAASPGEATWNERIAGTNSWGDFGGLEGTDYVSPTSVTRSIAGLGLYDFTSTGIVADAQTWLNLPGTNFGWFLMAQFESTMSTAKHFGSREGGTNAPQLILNYTVPGSNDPPAITQAQVTNDLFAFSFIAEAGRSYAVERRGSFDTNAWGALMNVGPLEVATNFVVTDSLTPTNAFYRVRRN